MATVRRADATWEGKLASGTGQVTASSSSAFTDLPVSWPARTEQPNGRTSPEELVAAAHASCYAMAFSDELAKAGATPRRLRVSAAVTFDRLSEGWRVVSSALTVTGSAEGIDAAGFQRAAEDARTGCPISQALKGNVQTSVHATFEG